MRLAIRALVVAIGIALLIAGGLSPDHAADTRSQVARAATVVKAQQPSDSEQGASEQDASEQGERDSADQRASGAAADRARQVAQAHVAGATAREVEREAGDDDNPASAWEVELVRPDGSTVEVDLDAGFKVLATDRDDDRRNDSGNDD
jgi:uncharacterized membrane protein YkoI